METNPENKGECKKKKMDFPVLVKISKGETLNREIIGNKNGTDDLKTLRKSVEIVQQDLNIFLTKLVEEERRTAPTEQIKDESSDSDDVSDNNEDQDLDNLIKKTISSKKTR